jgi:hypothetical protein
MNCHSRRVVVYLPQTQISTESGRLDRRAAFILYHIFFVSYL